MVDTIKTLCDQENTSIKAIERELGLGNGTIRKWDKSYPSVDKALKVAKRFGVSIEYLIDPELEKEIPAFSEKDGVHGELLRIASRVPREDFDKILSYARWIAAGKAE